MGFHEIRFPLDVALGARGGPERKTDIVTLDNGSEERNQRWADARRRYNAAYGIKSRADIAAVVAFFEERRGRFHAFLWRDALDNASRDGTPTPFDQALGVGDGQRTDFALTKLYGGAFDPYRRPITRPVNGTVRVGVGGIERISGWQVVVGGIVRFGTAPAAGLAVTAGFVFDVPVRFDTDRLEVDLTSFDAAEIAAIPIIEVRE